MMHETIWTVPEKEVSVTYFYTPGAPPYAGDPGYGPEVEIRKVVDIKGREVILSPEELADLQEYIIQDEPWSDHD